MTKLGGSGVAPTLKMCIESGFLIQSLQCLSLSRPFTPPPGINPNDRSAGGLTFPLDPRRQSPSLAVDHPTLEFVIEKVGGTHWRNKQL